MVMKVGIRQHLEQQKIQLKNYNQKNKSRFFFYQMARTLIVMQIKMVKQILLILQNRQKFQFISLYLTIINNEAFAVQVLSFLDHFGIADDDARVNKFGGAIAFGHPLASSGVRLMNQLAKQFEEHPEVRFGLTTMCIGLGMGGSVVWENSNWKG